VVIAQRHLPGKAGKVFDISIDGLVGHVNEFFDKVHKGLYDQALAFREENTHEGIEDYDTFKQMAEDKGGFLKVHWAGSNEDEEQVKQDLKFTVRCFPQDAQDGPKGKCFYTGKETNRVAIFARAY
ncbi:MAG TPA: proline--tRNA ligase, partial [Myxococcales bacterium]|nr:proline--tRNA ligase [Myxococcales bacterium]